MTLTTIVSDLKALLIADSVIEASWLFTDDDVGSVEKEAAKAAMASPGVAIMITMPSGDGKAKGVASLMLQNNVVVTVIVSPTCTVAGLTAKGLVERILRTVRKQDPGRLGNRYEIGSPAYIRDAEACSAFGCHVYDIQLSAVSSNAVL